MSVFFRHLFFRRLAFALGLGATLPALAQNDAASRRAAIDEIYPVMIAALEAKNFGRARNICDQAILWEPQNPVHHYNLACIEAQAGRLPQAFGALELAVALGFDEADHLQADQDLVPLRSDPRFAEIVRKVLHNATAGDALASVPLPPAASRPAPPVAPAPEASNPPPPSPAFENGVPVGLYYMTRYRSGARALEQGVWYFSPDGTVYQNLEYGFSPADLAAHAGPRGRIAAKEEKLEVGWSDGTRNSAPVERDGAEFTWDLALFSPIAAFDEPAAVAGVYQGGDTLTPGGGKLDLRRDGTFVWEGVSLARTETGANRISAHPGTTNGRWELNGFSLILIDENGVRVRRLTFPSDDEKTIVKPDRMFLGGSMFRRLP